MSNELFTRATATALAALVTALLLLSLQQLAAATPPAHWITRATPAEPAVQCVVVTGKRVARERA